MARPQVATRRNNGTSKKKVADYFDRTTIGWGNALIKVFSELCYYEADAPEPISVQRIWQVEELVLGDEPNHTKLFAEPKLVKAKRSENCEMLVPDTHWHKAILEFYKHYEKTLETRWKSQKPKVTDKREYGSIVGTVDISGHKFPCNSTVAGQDAWFKVDEEVPMLVGSKRCLFADHRACSDAVRAHPLWLINGTCDVCIMFVSPEQHVANPDLKSWLQKVDVRDLHQNPACILRPQDACWVPAGWVPIWIVLPPDVNLYAKRPRLAQRGKPTKGKSGEAPLHHDAGGVAIIMCYNKAEVQYMPDDVRMQMITDIAAARPLAPKKLVDVDGVKEWMEAVCVGPVSCDGDI